MKVTVNGKTMEVAENTHLTDLIVSSKVKAEAIIVVLNDVVVRKDLWLKTVLKEGDSMELVSLVGGG
jgi:sulfur carrier protein